MRLVLLVVTNALALLVAIWLLDGITLSGDSDQQRWLHLAIIGAILGVVNAVVRPIVNVLAFPLIILTLGLMLIVTNALMLLLTSKISDGLDLGFHVEGFWTAVGGAIVVSIATYVIESILPKVD